MNARAKILPRLTECLKQSQIFHRYHKLKSLNILLVITNVIFRYYEFGYGSAAYLINCLFLHECQTRTVWLYIKSICTKSSYISQI